MPVVEDRPGRPGSPTSARSEDWNLVRALRTGDEAAFVALLDHYHASMVRLAKFYVPNDEVAEEVAQETWIGVLRGIDQFEGRAAFKTWLFRILVNQAKRRGAREARSVPFSALARAEIGGHEPAVEPERFLPAGHEDAGHWAAELRDWRQTPEDVVLAQETRVQVRLAIADLPPGQRLVITMRDIEGWTADEVCNALAISETNQRVLLHRARSKVRRALERYLEGA
ncbi:MAG: sigma-70 family RNA polymerase sigma factor [Chloroflexota bacterium]|nr:sigma-70 family RNA polymerase sigma factor [Chloroflexota bacterium]